MRRSKPRLHGDVGVGSGRGSAEQALARGFALLEGLFDPHQLLVGGGEVVDVADEAGEVGR